VAAACRRWSNARDFRSNLHRGGTAEKVVLPPEFERTAIEAARIVELRVAGVDMLESNRGPLVIEVNSSPGLEGIEAISKVDLATQVIVEMEKLVEKAREAPHAVPRHLGSGNLG
jgi:ribosomal protein S6--L-glutamate ligase